jgi:hypothetical protein
MLLLAKKRQDFAKKILWLKKVWIPELEPEMEPKFSKVGTGTAINL